MMICRCAWHPRYYGYPFWSGVASWRGVAVQFTDGICPRCASRFREENRRFLERRRDEAATPEEVATAPAA
jgi:hypothetical protein